MDLKKISFIGDLAENLVRNTLNKTKQEHDELKKEVREVEKEVKENAFPTV